MLHLGVPILLTFVFGSINVAVGWNPANFSFNPGDQYQLVWQDQFENVGPSKAIIDGKPAYAPNPKNWGLGVGTKHDGGIENYTDSIQNAYVQNNQLTIVAVKDGDQYISARLSSKYLQEFTFGVFAAKIRMPYSKGIWPGWWLTGDGTNHSVWWPTTGEIDIIEMLGGSKSAVFNDKHVISTIHWNNQSNTMNPQHNHQLQKFWSTPDGSMLHNNSLVYWTEWNTTMITIGVNEFIISQQNTTELPNSINPSWAFSGKWSYELILNIAVGGNWAGSPDNTTVWPQKMVVDWVRVYQEKKTTRLF